jgi:hypothetical protein
VLLDPAQRGVQVGHYLLRPHDPDRAGGAAGVAGQLAAAGRGDHQGAGLGDRGHAPHGDVGAGQQLPDIVRLGSPVHGQDARPHRLVPPAGADVLLDAGQAKRFTGPGEHTGALGYQVLDAGTRGGHVIEDLDGETVCRQRGRRPLQVRRGRRVGEQSGRNRGRHGASLGW